jgi:hypothetical protein
MDYYKTNLNQNLAVKYTNAPQTPYSMHIIVIFSFCLFIYIQLSVDETVQP